MTQFDYDVAIVGSGAAGALAAYELTRLTGLRVLMLEKMKRLHDSREVANGFMGGSSRSDVKLFLQPGFGGIITNPYIVPELLDVLEQFGRHRVKLSKAALQPRQVEDLQQHGVQVDEPQTAVLNSEVFTSLEKALYQHLLKRLEFKSNCSLNQLEKIRGGFRLITAVGDFTVRHCLLSLGRGGAHWLTTSGVGSMLDLENDQYDLGVRLEFPRSMLRDFTDRSTNFRLRFGDYRTTAISDGGTVELENVYEVKTSNGRTMIGKQTGYSSFGLLKTMRQENALGKVLNLVQIVNILADDLLIKEPVGKFFTSESQLCNLPEFVELRDGVKKILEVWPALKSRCSLYAPEARLNSLKVKVSQHFESSIRNLYVCGDMSGQTKSFVQAACSGMLAARHVAAKEGVVVGY